MRTRVTSDWPRFVTPHVQFTHPSNPPIDQDLGIQEIFSRYSKISDVQVGKKQGIESLLYKPVQHLKVEAYPILAYSGYDPTSGYTANVTNQNLLPERPWYADDLVPYPSQQEVSACAERAYKQWATVIPDNVSIANFIWELREIKSLIPQLMRFKTLSSAEFGKNLGTISNNYLAYQFGWKPLLSDIKKFCRLIPSVIDRIEFLKKSYRKFTYLNSYSGDFTANHVQSVPTGGAPTTVEVRTQISHFRSDFRAKCIIWHDIPDLDGDLVFLKAFATALGLNRPGSIIWNAIPFSFLVDWFVKVGDYVDARSTLNFMGGRLRVYPLGYSVKTTCRVVFWLKYLNNGWNHMGHIKIERYARNVGIPISASELVNTDLTSTQQTLLAALGHQALSSRRS